MLTLTTNDPYASGVLKPEVHSRLVADLERIARDAAIQPRWVYTPLADQVPAGVLEWVRQFRSHVETGRTGLCLVGGVNSGAESVMSAVAGALVRNFIRARVLTAGQVADMLDRGQSPEATCLLVPNLHAGKTAGAAVPAWRAAMLLDLLLERHLSGLQTVIHVSELKALKTDFGSGFSAMLGSHYVTQEL